LTRELERTGSKSDLLEAAQRNERAYVSQSGGRNLRFANRAIELFERAGEADRANALRTRALENLGAETVLAELRRHSGEDLRRTKEILAQLCDSQALRMTGAGPCVSALELAVPGLSRSTDRAAAHEVADSMVQLLMLARGTIQGRRPVDQPKLDSLAKLWDELAASGLASTNMDQLRGGAMVVVE
jgi:hypothetical protein